ncbi:efflux RND transporter permease subunit [Mucilaginibacter sp. cycad4]|uniref:efflux RND transporter permease subunit n=1 Tax=Mucilaginibacter sp. cycad4 TaxID=3342096 RepID=UPI002AABE552|nr:efflux RND transporter permease subunit [Mucilaginibacter gossypii]WPU99140.1 efflux RND transporter permease subunit [Mucilaginibacter gossypii]
MLKNFISKPVLATVVSILLLILGALGLSQLPVQQFPEIAPPCVAVRAVYPGANAETILRSVTPSLEEAINGVENITYMSSVASNDGTLTISVFFKLGTNPDQAAVNVQNRVSQATSQLPPEVVQQGIVTQKQQNSFIEIIGLNADDKRYDQTFLDNYASINILPEIRRIEGVGQAALVGGTMDYSMRVWLNPSLMRVHNVTPDEVAAAIQDKSLEAAPGRFGDLSNEVFEYVLKYKGKLNKAEDYENIPIKGNSDGSILRLKDVARVQLGSVTYASNLRLNGHISAGLGIIQLAGSNSNQIQIEVGKLMTEVSKKFPKGLSYHLVVTNKHTLDESISQVEHTLLEAFALVFIVVFIFLQDFRSTLIPAIAVPVAIVATFFFMYIFGFTINLLTLFALVLAIGIVVDDAIVVVEAVHSKMEHEHLPARQATIKAMHEITGAIISITLVMAAVFLPVGFMKGSTGLFYRQFAFTMAIAIVVSAVNALTLSPALAALFLKNQHIANDSDAKKKTYTRRFFNVFNVGFKAVTTRYTGIIEFLIKRKWIALGGLVIVIIATGWMIKTTPTGFIPTEDGELIFVATATPSGTSLTETNEIVRQAENILRKEESALHVVGIPGFNLLTTSNSPSSAVVILRLKQKEERGKVKDINEIINKVNGELNGTIRGASFYAFSNPTIPGFSNIEAIDMELQDRSSGPLNIFSNDANSFIAELNKQPAVGAAFTTFKADYPQYEIGVDDDKATQLGVKVKDVLSAIQGYFGTIQASDFNRFGKYYRVKLQADGENKRDLSSLNAVYVKNVNGDMVPVNSLVTLKRVFGSETASRYNLFNSIQINVIPKPGHSSGEAIQAIRDLAAKRLPVNITYEFSGQTKEEITSSGQSTIIFILCLVFVYFLLSAQYESYILPLAVILSIPTGVFGVFAMIGMKGIDNNIYVQVALVMLIGLLAKNAILIVEFAVQRRRTGMGLVQAAVEASTLRLRPIIMTSLAFIFGLFPMSIAEGPSAQGNHSISYAAVGGMLAGVVLGVLLVPVLFVIFQSLQEKLRLKMNIHQDDDTEFALAGKFEEPQLK